MSYESCHSRLQYLLLVGAFHQKCIKSSHFFKKGIFNHNNASDIAKSLKDNGFFRANHGVYINELGKKVEVASEQALEDIISKEKEAVLNDESLQKAFNAIDKILSKNKDVREVRDYIESNKFILPELKNLNVLKQELWIAYLTDLNVQRIFLYSASVTTYSFSSILGTILYITLS